MTATLSPRFERLIHQALPERRDLAADVLKLSDFYHAHAGEPTPWREAFTLPAYLAYFLPLNYARLQSVWHEVARVQSSVRESLREIWDFGSGLGTTHWVLEDSELAGVPLYCVERGREAVELHRRLADAYESARFRPVFTPPPRGPGPGALGVFSYSFLEMRQQLPPLERFEHLLIVEPSTRECGRELMEWRGRLLQAGFEVLAPCTHSAACPLLAQSGRDWCHMRTAFAPPEWWRQLEERLPMKNRTLTYSYLWLSRSLRRTHGAQARVIGDTLEERGKTRQMICRGPQREFVSWLHRNGTPPRILHGSLLLDVSSLESKGSELRVPNGANVAWQE